MYSSSLSFSYLLKNQSPSDESFELEYPANNVKPPTAAFVVGKSSSSFFFFLTIPSFAAVSLAGFEVDCLAVVDELPLVEGSASLT